MEKNQRTQLEFFVSEPCRGHKDGDLVPFFIEHGQILFVGTELYMEGCKFTYYIAPIDNHSGMLFLYLGNHAFDELREGLNKYTMNVAKETWPLLLEALDNGEKNNCSQVAIAKVNLGYYHFWGSFIKLENIEFSDLETDYIGYNVGFLIGRTSSILQEYIENDISSFQKIKIATK
ncbi:MAG: hypothetical protein K2K21_01555, partial [Lachnospiraceae bacterium]|nr:hypothetical protein [Lachnospiraceae bacterium]